MLQSISSRFSQLSKLGYLVPPDKSKTLLSLQETITKELRGGADVVTVLIDGLGYDSVCKLAKQNTPVVSWAKNHGRIEPTSAQWPSTTAAQITSLHSAQPIEQHGVLEWIVYEPKLEKLISPLPFNFAGEDQWGTLIQAGMKPTEVFPDKSFYGALKEGGVSKCRTALPAAFAHSHFNSIFSNAVDILPYGDFSTGCEEVAKAILKSNAPSYSLLYIDDMDKISHKYTKDSPEFAKRIQEIFKAIEENLVKELAGSNRPCIVHITSDHGHVTVDPRKTFYINHIIPNVDDYLQRTSHGEVIPCSGSSRSLFLHAKSEKRDALIAVLQEKLEGHALVAPLEELFQMGFFDKSRCSDRFWKRVGNIVVLPFPGKTVYYHIPGKFEIKKNSLHGGASPEEMTTPHIFFPVKEFLKEAA